MENKIYTGCGDGGYTDTICQRLLKDDILIELLGTLDEATSLLGLAKAQMENESMKEDIETLQKKLMFLMGEVAGTKRKIEDEDITCCEKLCDKYGTSEIKEFVLPGGNIISARLDVARTVIRRAERVAVRLFREKEINKKIIVYLNRLSDLVYLMARSCEK